MKLNISVLLLIFCVAACAVTSKAKTSPEILARAAVSADPNEAAAAIAELRETGPDGLSILLRIHSDEINRQITTPAVTPEWQRLSSALDAVSQQKDSYLSGLYWYTDLNQAEAAARASGKPILSLRLLGKLSDEFSCANSRFFRTILYSNLEVSHVLREQFILHWQSVRPVPRVTIDFGDGRKLESTITGNSIHYVLASNGQPLDALPGLYGPESFLRSLAEIRQLHERLKRVPAEARFQMLDEYHRASVRTLTANWLADAQKAGGKIPEYLLPKSATTGTARAVEIAPLAVTKRITEVSLLKAITRDAEALGVVTDEPTWTRIALQHIGDAKLDDRSFSLILRQTKDLFPIRRSSDFNPQLRLASLVQKLQWSIAMDTVRNEYMLRPKLHAWLAVDPARANLDALNEKVYAELFLTPKTDPWLGLFSPEIYNGLDGAGVTP
ncbi:MAG TPA: hypothetical protein VE135_00205 [Pyrinomonadaceae bacterium]|nr:hypothetical protein [Pyrinomonadaceae bacterium]